MKSLKNRFEAVQFVSDEFADRRFDWKSERGRLVKTCAGLYDHFRTLAIETIGSAIDQGMSNRSPSIGSKVFSNQNRFSNVWCVSNLRARSS